MGVGSRARSGVPLRASRRRDARSPCRVRRLGTGARFLAKRFQVPHVSSFGSRSNGRSCGARSVHPSPCRPSARRVADVAQRVRGGGSCRSSRWAKSAWRTPEPGPRWWRARGHASIGIRIAHRHAELDDSRGVPGRNPYTFPASQRTRRPGPCRSSATLPMEGEPLVEIQERSTPGPQRAETRRYEADAVESRVRPREAAPGLEVENPVCAQRVSIGAASVAFIAASSLCMDSSSATRASSAAFLSFSSRIASTVRASKPRIVKRR